MLSAAVASSAKEVELNEEHLNQLVSIKLISEKKQGTVHDHE